MKFLAWLPYLLRKLRGRGRTSKRLRKVGKLKAHARARYPDYHDWARRVQAEAQRAAE